VSHHSNAKSKLEQIEKQVLTCLTSILQNQTSRLRKPPLAPSNQSIMLEYSLPLMRRFIKLTSSWKCSTSLSKIQKIILLLQMLPFNTWTESRSPRKMSMQWCNLSLS